MWEDDGEEDVEEDVEEGDVDYDEDDWQEYQREQAAEREVAQRRAAEQELAQARQVRAARRGPAAALSPRTLPLPVPAPAPSHRPIVASARGARRVTHEAACVWLQARGGQPASEGGGRANGLVSAQ